MLDPSNWYLTLPTGHKGDPDTVALPKLADHSCTVFHLNDAKDGIVFTANAGGVTTSGSSYPRSELREMTGSKLGELVQHPGHPHADRAPGRDRPPRGQARRRHRPDPRRQRRRAGGPPRGQQADRAVQRRQDRRHARPELHARHRRTTSRSPPPAAGSGSTTTARRSSTSRSGARAGTSSPAATCSPTPARATSRAPSAPSSSTGSPSGTAHDRYEGGGSSGRVSGADPKAGRAPLADRHEPTGPAEP